jgi:hypothetical protein
MTVTFAMTIRFLKQPVGNMSLRFSLALRIVRVDWTSNLPYMPKKIFFDTQIITMVSDGRIAHSVWERVLRGMESKFEYRVSFTTFIELLTALAGGDEPNFVANRRRLLVLTDVPGYEFLPMPGDFLRDRLLGLPPIRTEFAPSVFQNEWMPTITIAASKYELSQIGVEKGTLHRGIDFGARKRPSEAWKTTVGSGIANGQEGQEKHASQRALCRVHSALRSEG